MLAGLPVVECPKLIRNYCDGFKDLLATMADYQSFVALTCGAVFGIANISMIVRYFLFAPSVSSISRFLDTDDLAASLNRRHRRRLASIAKKFQENPDRYQYAVDDTLIARSGKSMWGVYSWYDHGLKAHINGHKLLVVGLVDRKRNVLIPLAWEILHRDLSDKVEMSPGMVPHRKAWQVALDLLDVIQDEGFPKGVVACDSWFYGAEFFSGLEARGFDYVVEARSSFIVKHHGLKRIDQNLTNFFADRPRQVISSNHKTKFASSAVLTLTDKQLVSKIVAVANRRGVDDQVFAYYASNRLTWDAAKIWQYSRGRWSIEVQFRELKQLFALCEAAVRSQQSVETAVSISMIALTVIRLEQLADADANKNQHFRPISAGAIVRDLEMTAISRGILKLALNPQRPTVAKFQSRYN